MTNKFKDQILEKFDKKFDHYLELNEGMIGLAVEEYRSDATEKVKSFILQALTDYEDDIIKRLKEKKKGVTKVSEESLKISNPEVNITNDYSLIYPNFHQYNQAVEDAIQIVKGEE